MKVKTYMKILYLEKAQLLNIKKIFSYY